MLTVRGKCSLLSLHRHQKLHHGHRLTYPVSEQVSLAEKPVRQLQTKGDKAALREYPEGCREHSLSAWQMGRIILFLCA